MKKIRLLLEYDGTRYKGWQIQKKGETIQGILEERFLQITGQRARATGASRTDAGVHAFGQVAVFRTETHLDPQIIKRAFNSILPDDMRVVDVSLAEHSFHPRKDAQRKTYFYLIENRRDSSVFLKRYAWTVVQLLQIRQMEEAGKILIGKHDFSSFMGSGSSIKVPVREIFSFKVEHMQEIQFMTMSLKGRFIRISIEADGFLRHMVRNIVGTLVEIGRGRMPVDEMTAILKSRDRRRAGPTAPSHGLFLEKITYPESL
jgi:tRNA pseudouridine38-40 synthase